VLLGEYKDFIASKVMMLIQAKEYYVKEVLKRVSERSIGDLKHTMRVLIETGRKCGCRVVKNFSEEPSLSSVVEIISLLLRQITPVGMVKNLTPYERRLVESSFDELVFRRKSKLSMGGLTGWMERERTVCMVESSGDNLCVGGIGPVKTEKDEHGHDICLERFGTKKMSQIDLEASEEHSTSSTREARAPKMFESASTLAVSSKKRKTSSKSSLSASRSFISDKDSTAKESSSLKQDGGLDTQSSLSTRAKVNISSSIPTLTLTSLEYLDNDPYFPLLKLRAEIADVRSTLEKQNGRKKVDGTLETRLIKLETEETELVKRLSTWERELLFIQREEREELIDRIFGISQVWILTCRHVISGYIDSARDVLIAETVDHIVGQGRESVGGGVSVQSSILELLSFMPHTLSDHSRVLRKLGAQCIALLFQAVMSTSSLSFVGGRRKRQRGSITTGSNPSPNYSASSKRERHQQSGARGSGAAGAYSDTPPSTRSGGMTMSSSTSSLHSQTPAKLLMRTVFRVFSPYTVDEPCDGDLEFDVLKSPGLAEFFMVEPTVSLIVRLLSSLEDMCVLSTGISKGEAGIVDQTHCESDRELLYMPPNAFTVAYPVLSFLAANKDTPNYSPSPLTRRRAVRIIAQQIIAQNNAINIVDRRRFSSLPLYQVMDLFLSNVLGVLPQENLLSHTVLRVISQLYPASLMSQYRTMECVARGLTSPIVEVRTTALLIIRTMQQCQSISLLPSSGILETSEFAARLLLLTYDLDLDVFSRGEANDLFMAYTEGIVVSTSVCESLKPFMEFVLRDSFVWCRGASVRLFCRVVEDVIGMLIREKERTDVFYHDSLLCEVVDMLLMLYARVDNFQMSPAQRYSSLNPTIIESMVPFFSNDTREMLLRCIGGIASILCVSSSSFNDYVVPTAPTVSSDVVSDSDKKKEAKKVSLIQRILHFLLAVPLRSNSENVQIAAVMCGSSLVESLGVRLCDQLRYLRESGREGAGYAAVDGVGEKAEATTGIFTVDSQQQQSDISEQLQRISTLPPEQMAALEFPILCILEDLTTQCNQGFVNSRGIKSINVLAHAIQLVGLAAVYVTSFKHRMYAIKSLVSVLREAKSRSVQRTASKTMTRLLGGMRINLEKGKFNEKVDVRDKLEKVLFDDKIIPDIRIGCAYGLAGVFASYGVSSLVVDCNGKAGLQLVKQLSSAKDYVRKEAACYLVSALCFVFGSVIEPFVPSLIRSILPLLADSNDTIRSAAGGAAKNIMSALSSFGVIHILPEIVIILGSKQWRSKTGALTLLGSLAYGSPASLSSALPQVIPLLCKSMLSAQAEVRHAAEHAFTCIEGVITNQEVSSIAPLLVKALVYPLKYVSETVLRLESSSFTHRLDAPSLALIIPVLLFGVVDKDMKTRVRSVSVISTFHTLTKPADLMPYLSPLTKALRDLLTDPVPLVRRETARALGSLSRNMSSSLKSFTKSTLLNTLKSKIVNIVERNGAAQALCEMYAVDSNKVVRAYIDNMLGKYIRLSISVSPGIEGAEFVKKNGMSPLFLSDQCAYTQSIGSTNVEHLHGHVLMLLYLPQSIGTHLFSPHLHRSLFLLGFVFAMENKTVRDIALSAGRQLISSFASDGNSPQLNLIVAHICSYMVSCNARIRECGLLLATHLASCVTSISFTPDKKKQWTGGRTSVDSENDEEEESDYDESVTEVTENTETKTLTNSTGKKNKSGSAISMDKVMTSLRTSLDHLYPIFMACVYVTRGDKTAGMRTSSVRLWKSMVSHPPSTIREILPAMFSVITHLGMKDVNLQEIGSVALTECIRSYPSKVLDELIEKCVIRMSQTEEAQRLSIYGKPFINHEQKSREICAIMHNIGTIISASPPAFVLRAVHKTGPVICAVFLSAPKQLSASTGSGLAHSSSSSYSSSVALSLSLYEQLLNETALTCSM
ncbi:Translational activator Gcn1 like protein, partial [Aduncisulcus paluster]